MHIGVVFPQTEIGADPAVIKDYAQAAEQLGFSHIQAYDHVLGAVHEGRDPPLTGPYTEATPFHEPLTLFAYLAGVTRSIGFLTGILIVTQRQTALVAKQAAEVAILSGNRLRLGIGTGWNYVEYEALGVPYRNRGAREEEQVELLRRLWREPVVDYTGRFHRIDRAGLQPLPSQPIPIWFGGSTDAVIERVARVGDGMIGGALTRDPATIERVRSLAEQAGRDPAEIGFEVPLRYAAGPDQWGRDIENWQHAGATHMAMNTMGTGLQSPSEHIEALRRVAAAVKLSG